MARLREESIFQLSQNSVKQAFRLVQQVRRRAARAS
jgi:hypothetical protein